MLFPIVSVLVSGFLECYILAQFVFSRYPPFLFGCGRCLPAHRSCQFDAVGYYQQHTSCIANCVLRIPKLQIHTLSATANNMSLQCCSCTCLYTVTRSRVSYGNHRCIPNYMCIYTQSPSILHTWTQLYSIALSPTTNAPDTQSHSSAPPPAPHHSPSTRETPASSPAAKSQRHPVTAAVAQ